MTIMHIAVHSTSNLGMKLLLCLRADSSGSMLLSMDFCLKCSCMILCSGRAGRVSNGRVYRLVPHRFWREHIQDYGLPEMQASLICAKAVYNCSKAFL